MGGGRGRWGGSEEEEGRAGTGLPAPAHWADNLLRRLKYVFSKGFEKRMSSAYSVTCVWPASGFRCSTKTK